MYYLYKLGKETREDFNYKKKSREKKLSNSFSLCSMATHFPVENKTSVYC